MTSPKPTPASGNAGEGANKPHDSRYEYRLCLVCGQTFQRIDFHGNPHYYFCKGAQP